jgi:aspartyl protease family protein
MRAIALAASLGILANVACAADISVVGLFPNKAVLVIDGSAPKTYSVGATVTDGVKLLGVDDSGALFESKGKREMIAIGGQVASTASGGPATTTLKANEQGHFIVQGQVNGGTVRMLLDTGATTVTLPASDAIRLGINYKAGQRGQMSTANGITQVYRIKLDTLRIGDIVLNQIDAAVVEQGLPIALLGMSFLNRTEMRREGETMTLTKRF